MNTKVSTIEWLREEFRRRAKEAWISFFDTGALCGASGCLADAKEITNPVEQVKYLFDRFQNMEAHFMTVPWAWLTYCIEKGTISKLPMEEDWVISLFLHRARFVGDNELALQLLSKLS